MRLKTVNNAESASRKAAYVIVSDNYRIQDLQGWYSVINIVTLLHVTLLNRIIFVSSPAAVFRARTIYRHWTSYTFIATLFLFPDVKACRSEKQK